MLCKMRTLFLVFLVSTLFVSIVNCQTTEADNSDEDSFNLADDCCYEGESWIENRCNPIEEDPDRTQGCIDSGKKCCQQLQVKRRQCHKGVLIAQGTDSCDNMDNADADRCCNECKIGMTLGYGSNGNCGEESENPEYTCCVFASSKQETTTEQASTTPMIELTTFKVNNQPVLNACEIEGDDICAHKCIPSGNSYKCQCRSGYKLWTDNHSCRKMETDRCQKKNPCAHKCTDTGDSIVCSCKRGYELMDDNTSCIDIDECALQTHNCKDGQKCVNTMGSHTCVGVEPAARRALPKKGCPTGYVFNPTNQVCDDDDECQRNPCPPGLSCVNNVGSYNCGFSPGIPVPPPLPVIPSPAIAARQPVDVDSDVICPPGFRLNEELGECKDINECTDTLDDCNRMSQICLNTLGTFICHDKASKTCPVGFKMNSKTECEDMDECAENPDICTPDSVCINEPGSYDCKSRVALGQGPSARPTQAPRSPQQPPPPVQPSRSFPPAIKPPTPIASPRKPNSPQVCPKGYRKEENGGCADIDECAAGTHTCDGFQDCINVMGGHRCVCKKGFQRDPITSACEDINECQRNELNDCSENQRCDNTIGSYYCIRFISCGTGYTLNSLSGTCEDNNECMLGAHDCDKLGPAYECLNLPGTYRCVRRPPPTTTTTTTPAPLYDYDSSEYYPDEEDDKVPPKETPVKPLPDPKQNARPTESPRKPEQTSFRQPYGPRRQDVTPSTPPYEQPKSEVVPVRQPYEPRRSEETPVRQPYEPRRQEETPVRQPYEPRRPEETPVRQPYEPRRPEETPVRQPYEPRRQEDTRTENPESKFNEPRENNNIDDIVTTPPSATRRFEYPPNENERRDDDYDDRNLPKPSVYYPRPKIQRPVVSEPKYTTLSEPKEKPGTLVGDHDMEGNIIVNTNDLKENTWTKLIPGAKRCLSGYAMDTNGECLDIDECRTGRNLCDSNTEVCINTKGDYRCVCAPGYLKDRVSGKCKNKDEMYPPPSIPGIQPVWAPRPKKDCDSGFQLDPSNNECVDIDECSDGISRCASNEQCINTLGGFRCQCSPGYYLLSGRCVQPPQTAPNRPRQQTSIVRVTTPPRHTFCSWGYTFENNRCVDVDECATNKHNCLPNQHCVNIAGGYLCHCAPGHRLVQDGGCEDVDECKESGGKVCVQYATCINTIGSFECRCRSGFATSPISRQLCNDVDECQENNGLGPCEQKCVNIWGSFRCACRPGFKLNPDNRTCSDIDECAEPIRRLCVGTCQNIPGSYECTCPNGYKMGLDKRSCIDIDECENGELICGSEEVCQNNRGGARCSSIACPPGYFRDPGNRNRCRRPPGICRIHDYECLHRPETYSFNFITFVSKLYIPTGPRPQVDLFTMKGPNWSESMLDFKLRLVDVRAPRGVPPADSSCFKMTPSPKQAQVSLVKTLVGPQDILLELSMDLFRLGNFEGTAVAKIIIYVSEYEF